MICIPALGFAAGTDVKTGGYVPHFDLKIHEPKLEVVEMMHNGKMKVKAPVADIREDAPKASPFSFDNGIRRLPVGLAAAQQYKERLDSIVGWYGNGQYKYTRQYFTYDADGNPVKAPTHTGTKARSSGTTRSLRSMCATKTDMCSR